MFLQGRAIVCCMPRRRRWRQRWRHVATRGLWAAPNLGFAPPPKKSDKHSFSSYHFTIYGCPQSCSLSPPKKSVATPRITVADYVPVAQWHCEGGEGRTRTAPGCNQQHIRVRAMGWMQSLWLGQSHYFSAKAEFFGQKLADKKFFEKYFFLHLLNKKRNSFRLAR